MSDAPSYYEVSIRRFSSRYWHRNIISGLRRILRDLHVKNPVLDLGCGDGVRAREALGSDVTIHGVDIDAEMVRHARRRLERVWLGDIQAPPDEVYRQRYGTILLMESLEHVDQPERVIRAAYRLLAPYGLLIVVVPIDNLLFRVIWWLWTRTLGRRWRGAHKHSFRSYEQLSRLLEPWFEEISHTTANLGCVCIAAFRRKDVALE